MKTLSSGRCPAQPSNTAVGSGKGLLVLTTFSSNLGTCCRLKSSPFLRIKKKREKVLLDCQLDTHSFEAVKCIPGGSQPS